MVLHVFSLTRLPGEWGENVQLLPLCKSDQLALLGCSSHIIDEDIWLLYAVFGLALQHQLSK